MLEVWKDVRDFEGLYQVSNLGGFRRHPDKESKCKYRNNKSLKRAMPLNKGGYVLIDLCKENIKYKKTLHQMVVAAFVKEFEYGTVINHIDGDKTNNRLDNLQPCSYQDNVLHQHKTGLSPKPGKSKYHNVCIQNDRGIIRYVARVKNLGKPVLNKTYPSEVEAAKAVDAFLDSIGDTRRNRNFP